MLENLSETISRKQPTPKHYYVHGVAEVLNDYPLAGSTLKRVETYSNLKRLMI